MNHKRVFLVLIVILVTVVLFLFFNVKFFSSTGESMSARTSVIIGQPPEEEGEAISRGGIRPESGFIVEPNSIKVVIKQGESERRNVRVINTGDTSLDIELMLGELEKFIILSDWSFSLGAGKSKTIDLDVFSGEDDVGVYAGNIVVKGDGITRLVRVVIEIVGRRPLFDITTDVIEKKLMPRDDVLANIEIVNLGDLENIDVLLYYAIKDFEGNVLLFEEESLNIGKKLDIERFLKIPEVSDGMYLFYSKVSYEDVSAESADIFEVISKEALAPVEKIGFNYGLLLIIALILIIFVVFASYKRRLR